MKIVSMAPNVTEMIFYFGQGDSLVGVTGFCNYPEEALNIEKVGGFADFNPEIILRLNPDIVIFSGNMTQQEKAFLDKYKIIYADAKMENINSLIDGSKKIAEILGCIDKFELFKLKIDSLLEFYSGWHEQNNVYLEISNKPLMCASEKSYSGEILNLLGCTLPKSGLDSPYLVISQEDVIIFNPEIIIAADFDSMIGMRKGWGNTNAVKNKRIYILSEYETDVISRPGPRIFESFEILFRKLYEADR